MKGIAFYIVSIALLLFGDNVQARQIEPKNYRLIVSLENADFDSLFAFDYTRDRNILFQGDKISDFVWEFVIPDSIATTSERLILLSSFYNSADTSSSTIRFFSSDRDRLPVVNIGL